MTREQFQSLKIGDRLQNNTEPKWSGRVIELRGYTFNHEATIQNISGRTFEVDVKNCSSWDISEE